MNLIERAKNIVLTPASEWAVIAAETTTAGELYRGYVVPLAAIGPVARFVGLSLIGVSVPFIGASVQMPLVWGLTRALVHYVLTLIGVYVISLIVNGLAPSFGGEKSANQALKIAVYAFTPAWLAGVLYLLPSLSLLVLLASLYGVYVLYLGLPLLMKSPPDRAVGYTAAVIVCAIVVMVIIGAVAGAVGRAGLGTSPLSWGRGESTSPVVAQIHAAAEQMRAARESGDTHAQAAAATSALTGILASSTSVEPVNQGALKTMLPETVGGMPRTSFEASRSGLGGVQVSKATARYASGNGGSIDLTITDLGGTKMLAMFAAWAQVEEDKESDTGYEKMGKVDGRPVHETFDKRGPSGDYAVVVAERFVVEARGSKVDMDTLKQSVAAIDLAKLESMKEDGVGKAN